jgi:hypothetical protein
LFSTDSLASAIGYIPPEQELSEKIMLEPSLTACKTEYLVSELIPLKAPVSLSAYQAVILVLASVSGDGEVGARGIEAISLLGIFQFGFQEEKNLLMFRA